MIALALLVVATVFAAYRLASDYVRRSLRSFATADNVRKRLTSALTELAESDAPPSVVQLAAMMGTVSGCGCLVRGILVGHFLPPILSRSTAKDGSFERAFSSLEALPPSEKALFDRVMAMAIVYDGFRNPLQGWILRHTLASLASSHPSYSAKLEAKLATASVLSRHHAAA